MNKNLERKYYELINARSFHDLVVIKYEEIEEQIIIEIDEGYNRGFRLILNNPKVIVSRLDGNNKLVEFHFELSLKKIQDVYFHNYEIYENKTNHLVMQYCVKSEEDRFSGIINVDYYTDFIIAEEFVINEKAEEYITDGDVYQNNLKEIKNMIDDETYDLLSQPYFNDLFDSKIDSYTLSNNLIINFKTNMFEKKFSLKFENVDMKIFKNSKEISKEKLENILKELFKKLKQEYPDNEYIPTTYDFKIFYGGMKFKKKNNLIEATILVTDDIEISILCSKVTLLDNNIKT